MWAIRASPLAQLGTWVPSLGQEDPLEKGMATHSSILAWRIPRTEEPGGLQYLGSQRASQTCLSASHPLLLFSCYLTMVLIYISLLFSDFEHLLGFFLR